MTQRSISDLPFHTVVFCNRPLSPRWCRRRPETSPCCWCCSKCSLGSCRGRKKKSSDGWNVPRSCSTRLGTRWVQIRSENGECKDNRIYLKRVFVKGYDSGGPSSKRTYNVGERFISDCWKQQQCHGVALPALRVADATVMRPGWLWNDAFLAERHRGNSNFSLKWYRKQQIFKPQKKIHIFRFKHVQI